MRKKLNIFFILLIVVFITQCSIMIISKNRGEINIDHKQSPNRELDYSSPFQFEGGEHAEPIDTSKKPIGLF